MIIMKIMTDNNIDPDNSLNFNFDCRSINQVYFQVNMYKNYLQKVQFTVIHVQGNHVHLKEHLTCNQFHKLTGKRWKLK